jgi:hypothetical protein
VTTFSYDTGHKLSNALDQTDSFTPSGSGAIAQSYLGSGQAELVSAGSVGLVNDLLGVGVRSSGGASTYYTRTPDGVVLGEHGATSSSYQYFLLVGLNSVVAITNSTGALLSTGDNYRYDPYGLPLLAAGEGGSTLLGVFGAEFGAQHAGAGIALLGGLTAAAGGGLVTAGC